jgi:alkylation response protein AidB-like acyl-CoA dehydrogenase
MLNMAIEEIAKACASTALILMIQELGTLPIKLFGSDELKDRFLPRCASGEWSPAFALSEPEAGSDPGGMITRAVRDGDEWVIDGTKNWITNLGIADFYVEFAVTDREAGHSRGITAFVVEADRPGFSVGKLEHKLGIRGSPTGQPIFDGVRVPKENVIGEVNRGFKVAMRTLDRSRLGVAAQALGIAQGATDYAAAYARERRQFGKPINSFQAIQFKLADMETQCAAARELLYQACAKVDRSSAARSASGLASDGPPWSHPADPDVGKYSAMAKLFCSDVAMKVTVEAVQVLGGYGYVKEYPVERMLRDAKITQIYEGTNEIQRLVIARTLA